MSSAPTRQAIFSLYRELFAMIHALPNKQKTNALTSLREGFRRNHNVSGEKATNLFKEAEKKAAYLRITTPLSCQRHRGQRAGTTTYVHGADGLEEGKSTLLKKGTIVSNWDGKNLDPCSVKRHNSQLRRAGFMNNSHAKGIF
mmetsp:Transcript_14516/g.18963  ORF Transcript_14516/g.18963 Transcript_14516/m.18963 type:complete len:143 (-) Transcript_14516:70-498(-)